VAAVMAFGVMRICVQAMVIIGMKKTCTNPD
jgi:hypothetical protein